MNDQQNVRSQANLISNMLVVQRNHEIADPLEQEMEFWLQEIEDMERNNRVRRGLPPAAGTPPREGIVLDTEEAKQVNPLEMIFVPDDWIADDKAVDSAFEYNNDERDVEVNNLMPNFEPIQLKRKNTKHAAASNSLQQQNQTQRQALVRADPGDLNDLQPGLSSSQQEVHTARAINGQAGVGGNVEDDLENLMNF